MFPSCRVFSWYVDVTVDERQNGYHVTLSCTLMFWPSSSLPPSPPSLPPSSLGSGFLPVSTSLGEEECLIQASTVHPPSPPSLLSLSLFLSVDWPLANPNGLHYLPSSPSSKMTFPDFTKARQFNSAKPLQSRKGKTRQWNKNLILCHVRVTPRARRNWCQV